MKIYKSGDWIVHVNYGVGQIRGLENKRLGDKDNLYYRVEGQNGTFWLQVEKADTERVRPVVSKRNFQEVIHALGGQSQDMESDYKKRQMIISEIRAEGSAITTACLVRDLSYGRRKKELSLKEQEVLEDLKKRLIMEWSVVLDVKLDEARLELDKVLLDQQI